jgi:hypothetical protein
LDLGQLWLAWTFNIQPTTIFRSEFVSYFLNHHGNKKRKIARTLIHQSHHTEATHLPCSATDLVTGGAPFSYPFSLIMLAWSKPRIISRLSFSSSSSSSASSSSFLWRIQSRRDPAIQRLAIRRRLLSTSSWNRCLIARRIPCLPRPRESIHGRCLSSIHWLFPSFPSISSTSTQQRSFSSRRQSTKNKKKEQGASSSSSSSFQLEALPFSISPEQALESFRHWAEQDQGLRYLMSYDSVRVGAAYVPVWSFDVNIRFAVRTNTSNNNKRSTTSYDWKPSYFQVYGNDSSVVHLPGLSAYAGYSYRRSLVNPVHSATLVFMGDRTERFGGWMLRDMTLQATGQPISVVPDAWNATQARSFAVMQEELNGIAQQEWASTTKTTKNQTVEVQTQLVNSRRVYMPTYVIDYSIAGLEYRAFVSGCDKAATVSGVSHQILGAQTIMNSNAWTQSSRNFLIHLSHSTSRFLSPQTWPFVIRLLGPLLSLLRFGLFRIWAAIPVLGVAGGALAGFRKILQPWMDNRSASAEWERQREHEALCDEEDQDMSSSWGNDFDDSTGKAQAYFMRNRGVILNHLSGPEAHEQGDYDWYKDWQEWARQQWEKNQSQQQQQQQYGYGQQQQQQRQQQQRTRRQAPPPKPEFKWDFDPHDPYSVLGIYRSATKEQVSAAFRKNMLQYHPDTQVNASDAQKLRALERSKLITEAYRKIKTERKR